LRTRGSIAHAMARPVTTLVIFFVAFNLFAGMLMSTGVAATLGLDANVGGDDAVDKRTGEMSEDVTSGPGGGSTLFGMYNVLSNQISGFFGLIFPGLNMLNRAGVPGFITYGFLAPLFSLMSAIGVVSFLRGWDL